MGKALLITLVIVILLIGAAGAYLAWTQRPLEQTEEDVGIIMRTLVLLEHEDAWLKADDRDCESEEKLSLYCALRQASIDVTGDFRHRAAALQEVRHSIDELHPDNDFAHRLMDFNNSPDVTLEDVHYVLRHALVNLEQKWNTR